MKAVKVVIGLLLIIFLTGCIRKIITKEEKISNISSNEIHNLLVAMKNADKETRLKYIDNITKTGHNAVNPLIKELSYPDAEIQESAAALLGIISDTSSVHPLIQALEGGIQRKYIAAWSLSKIHDARAIPPLIKSLEDPDFEVRKYAIRALISFGKQAVQPLTKIVKHNDPNVRAGAARALGEIGGKETVEPLLSIINDENEDVISSVTWAIGKVGDDRAVEPLLKLIYHKNKLIRINSARSLGIIGNKSAKETLEKILKEDNEFVVREWAARALENITGNRYKYIDDKGSMVEPYNLYR